MECRSSRIVPLHGNLYYGGLVWLFRIEVFGRVGRSSRFLFEILRCSAPQNESVPKLFSRRKEVTKKGRPLIIGYSFFPLRSPTEAAELAPLRQPSPYFYLLSRSRQPDKGGHFPTPTLPTIKVWTVAICHSE